MFRHESEVRPHDLRRHEVDPTAPQRGAHYNFDQILWRCGEAWIAMLASTGAFDTGVILPRLEVDFLREVGVGDFVVDVVVLSVGRTSFRMRLDVRQAGERVATVQAVLVSFDYEGGTPQPLTDAQRTALEALQDEAA